MAKDRATSQSRGPGARLARMADRALSLIAAALLMLMMFLTLVDVIGRYLFNSPLPGGFELTEVAMAALIFAGLPHVCRTGGHVAVGLLSDRLPAALRNLHGILSGLIMAGVLSVLSWRLWLKAGELAEYGDVTVFLRIPHAPIAYLASVLLAVSALLALVHAFGAGGRPEGETAA